LAQAQAALDKLLAGPASTDVTIAQAAVDQAKISLDTARQNLAKATLTAPFDGTVTQVNVIPGQTVAGGTVVVSVADLGRLRVKANVAEIDVPRIKVGQPVNVSVDAIPDAQLTGKLSDVALVGTVSQGVVNYAVTVDLDPTDSRVKAGMSASLVIVVDERSNVLMVPNRAIHTLTGGRGYYVDVMVEGQIVQVQVNIGLANDSMTEITGGGLREGDAVVISTSRTTTSGGGTFGGLFRGMGGGGVPVINQRTGD
jgi:RND family efflux transporter MFP subunit